MKIIDLRYNPEDFDDIKPLLPSLVSKCNASRYEQTPKQVFQSLAFGNKKYNFCPSIHNKHLKGKS